MANIQAWQDFNTVIKSLIIAVSGVGNLVDRIKSLETLKAKIIEDTVRRDELLKILDIHPDYSLQWVQARLTKLETLLQYLEDNGYTQI